MNQGHYANKANEIRRLQDIIGKLTRERDALQQQNYDLAAKVVYLEKELDRELEHSTNVIHDQGARILALEAQ